MCYKSSQDNFFHTLEIFGKICGVWWPDKKEKRLKKMAFIIWNLLVLSIALLYFTCELLMIRETISELRQIFRYIGMLFSHVVGLAKFCVLVANQRRINNVKETLLDKRFNYEKYRSFQPGKIYNDSKKFCRKFILITFFVYYMVGGSAHISALVALNTNYKEEYFHGNVTCNDFMPYFFVIPFPTPTKTSCKNAFIFMNGALWVLAWYIAIYDASFSTILLCVKTKLQILYEASKTIRERTLNKMNWPKNFETFHDEDFPEFEEELYHQIQHCAKHLDSLLRVCDEIENIFTYITLMQTLASLLVIASNMFVASQLPITDPELFSTIEYMLAVLSQLSMICYFGSEVTEVSSTISYSLYSGKWLSASRRFKTCMLIMMCRLQRKVHLSIGKFTPLTLNTLLMVLRGSFSYYTLFRTVE